MTVIARKYNPGFLTDDELVASFCVRTEEFESMIETLRECTGSANTHQIVIGPRGSGKTSLLLRVAAEIRRDEHLSALFFPIVFAEESYEVSTAGEFWLECLSRLADQAPSAEDGPDLRQTFKELRQIRDDIMLGDRCLGVLQDFADREDKRLVLIVENLNMLLEDIGDDDTGWRLRQTLQNEPRILLLASATSRFDRIDSPKHAFYDLFRALTLRPLDKDDCATLWRVVSGQRRAQETIHALRILTGGSPRLLTILARFGAKLSFRELMADLLDLVDDHTEYFKSHLETLPAQERKVYLALADLWKPANAHEIAARARLDNSKCSAFLTRLTERGAVEVAGGSPRRKLYYVSERLYNIYYLMRRARGPDPLIRSVIRFMEWYYSPAELMEFGVRMTREARGLDGQTLGFYRTALDELLQLPSLNAHRQELLSLTPATFAYRSGDLPVASAPPPVAKALFDRALALATGGRVPEALAAWKELESEFSESDTPRDRELVATILMNQGTALVAMNRPDEALAAWDEVVRRYGSGGTARLFASVARALVNKAAMLSDMKRQTEALAVCDELLDRVNGAESPEVIAETAAAMICKGHVLWDLTRPDEATAIWDEVVQRFGNSDKPAILEQVASVLLNKGAAFAESNRLKEALTAWRDLVERFGGSRVPAVFESVTMAFANTGAALVQLGRPDQALAAWDEVLRRSKVHEMPESLEVLTNALLDKGSTLLRLERPEEALETWDEVVRRADKSGVPTILQQVCAALSLKGNLLGELKRPEEALAVWDETLRRFGDSDDPRFESSVVEALVSKGILLAGLGRQEVTLEAWDEVERRFGSNESNEIQGAVAVALFNKGMTLAGVDRREEALAAWDEVIRRFGSSDAPMVRESVAAALVNKGGSLAQWDRPSEALHAWEEVERRFGSSAGSTLRDAVSTALLGKGAILTGLGRKDEALEACDQVVQRNSAETSRESLEAVATALTNKGSVLVELNRSAEALAAWEEVIQRFEQSEAPLLRYAAETALLKKAAFEKTNGRFAVAIELANSVLEREDLGFKDMRLHGHMIRARAFVAEASIEAATRDVEAALAILPDLDTVSKGVLDGLIWLVVDLGSETVRDLIVASPSSDLLLPLTTALEKELGLKPRVAKEVEEVAEDILRDLKGLREERSGDGDALTLDPGSGPG